MEFDNKLPDKETTRLLDGTEDETSYGGVPNGDTLYKNKHSVDAKKEKARWNSIRVMYFTIFCEAVTYSVTLPSLWSFLQDIDPSATATLLGWANSTQGLFALFSGFVCGWMAGKYNCKAPLIVTLVVGLLANTVYACVYIPEQKHRSTFLLLSRALAGILAGCITVTRVYVNEGTTLSERTQISSRLVTAQLVGYTIGPLLQVAYVPIGEVGWTVGAMKINVYTFPALSNFCLIFINLVLIIFVFREIRVSDESDQKIPEAKIENSIDTIDAIPLSAIDLPVVMYLNAVFCVAIFSFGVNTTLVSPYGMHMFGWTREEAVEKSSIISLTLAILAIVVIAVMSHLLKRFKERVFLALGLAMMIVCTLLAIPMGPGVPPRPDKNITNGTDDDDQGGCPWTYDWCDTTPAIPLIQFIFSLSILGVGYPMLQAIAYIIYCKTLAPGHQGLLLGIFASMGNTGRVLGPLIGSFIYTELGVQWAEGFLLIMLTIVATGIFPFYRRIVPYTEHQQKHKKLIS
ncbi:major facilitator superfamily domain-containing protein 8-like [Anneissia japonica]|uniref:major facilitator superfamily domain-containing protein 8-like n=1 Tax=Anneissia japonica TaxID=1529436 RepID=UPI001425899B|nr:major facilitator superfamily domain-containing protein 8-like [Anneissia japonica]